MAFSSLDATPLQKLALSDESDTYTTQSNAVRSPSTDRRSQRSVVDENRFSSQSLALAHHSKSEGRFSFNELSSLPSATYSSRPPLSNLSSGVFRFHAETNKKTIDPVQSKPFVESAKQKDSDNAERLFDTDDEVETEYQKLLEEARRVNIEHPVVGAISNTNSKFKDNESLRKSEPITTLATDRDNFLQNSHSKATPSNSASHTSLPSTIRRSSTKNNLGDFRHEKTVNENHLLNRMGVSSATLHAYNRRDYIVTPSTSSVHGLSYYGIYSQTLLGSWECGKCKKNSIGNFCHHCGSRCVMLQLVLADEKADVEGMGSGEQHFSEVDVVEAQALLALPSPAEYLNLA